MGIILIKGNVNFKTGATFNDDMIVQCIDKILKPYMLSREITKLYLIYDSAKCHLTSKVINHVKSNNIHLIVIPPRLTNLLQLADVMFFSVIKKSFHEKWNYWFLNAPKDITCHGNLKSPGYVQVIS